ncbi:MAG TPA: hypothetical protein VKA09_09045 [Nitrososphaeraceae archaeon]|nr:hypothetical protein [Nitrososphaeraceae archaeon]
MGQETVSQDPEQTSTQITQDKKDLENVVMIQCEIIINEMKEQFGF